MIYLCYHSIANIDDPWAVSPGRFAWQARWLARLSSNSRFGVAPVALCCDDGYTNFADVWPAVRDLPFRTILFAVSGKLGKVADWEGAAPLPLLNAEALRDLARQGVEIGAHSVTHARLSRLPPDQAREEMVRSKADLEAITGAPVRSFAYPYGEATPALAHMAEDVGFARAFTMRSGRGGSPFWMRRTPILRRDGKLRFMLKVLTGYATWLDVRMDLIGAPG